MLTGRQLRFALGQLFSRRWLGVTLAVIAICAGLARLGFWQLDRLAGRHARSAELVARLDAPPLRLTGEGAGGAAGGPAEADALAYRRAVVRGAFDYDQEVALVNQVWNGQLGFHLITPLVIEGSERAVLVDRGWIPAASESPDTWARYRALALADTQGDGGAQGQAGLVEVDGWIRPAPAGGAGPAPAGGGRPVPGMPPRLVADLDPGHLQAQVHHPLLPLVVVQVPEAGVGATAEPATGDASGNATGDAGALPYRQRPNPDLGDGVHLIAAAQWFAFSVIGAAGYVIYLGRYSTSRGGRPK